MCVHVDLGFKAAPAQDPTGQRSGLEVELDFVVVVVIAKARKRKSVVVVTIAAVVAVVEAARRSTTIAN